MKLLSLLLLIGFSAVFCDDSYPRGVRNLHPRFWDQFSTSLDRLGDQISSAVDSMFGTNEDGSVRTVPLSSRPLETPMRDRPSSPAFNPFDIGGPVISPFFNLFNIAKARNWWDGENVCIERTETDELLNQTTNVVETVQESEFQAEISTGSDVIDLDESGEEIGEREARQFQSHLRMSSCQETISSYVCTTRVRSNGKRKTYKTKYSCCYGTVRNPSGIGCTPAEVRSLSETLLSAGARSFAAAIQSNTATERMGKGNYTFFVPLDEVKTPEFAEENIVVVDEDAELLKNANQDPLENEIIRKRREIYSSHILDHIIPGIYMSGDLKDEMLIETEDSDAKIRINEYRIPQYVQTANCRRIMKSDQFTKEGVVHFIEGEMDPASKTLADILKSDARFSTFVKVMEDAGMTDTLEKPGQVTLFAPTNEAFEKLTATEREKILSGKGCVDSILKQHLLPNVICSTAVQARARTRTNAMSHVLLERKDNVLTVDGNPILRADVIGTNGIIHEIDSVLMPETAKSVIQVLEERNMTEFLNLLDQAVDQDGKSLNLRSTLEKLTNFTLFVPDNLTIKKFLEEQTEDPKRTENLLNVIYNHIAQPQLKATALRNGDVLSTIEGPGLRTQISQFESFLNILGSTKRATIQCVGLETYDIPVCGGVIHRVSSLLPKSVDSVWEVIMTDSSYSVFKQLLELTNLTETLKDKEESFTVFAPQNQAFYQLPEETLSEMMKEPEKALPVLKNHILPETVCCSSIEVTGFSLPVRKRTLNGSSVSLNSAIDGTRYVGGAKLMNCDKMAENGIVHGINKVLMPQATRIGPLPLFGMNRRVGLPGLEVVLFG